MSSVTDAPTLQAGSATPASGHRPGAVRRGLPARADIVIVGGGCAGLATALALAEHAPGRRAIVLDARAPERDRRTWCFWDDGSNPAPEAVARSWDRWEIRTSQGSVIASDPEHPYRMLPAADYRRAMRIRAERTGTARIHHDEITRNIVASRDSTAVETRNGVVTANIAIDARGLEMDSPEIPGRVTLYQRFIGQWIETDRPVFDPSLITLMDFTDRPDENVVQFMYVVPVSSNRALVESTIFARERDSAWDFRSDIRSYLHRRWNLREATWRVAGEEAGCIPMTDAPPDARTRRGAVPAVGVRGGASRPSTGYAVTRIWRQAQTSARAIAGGNPVQPFCDRRRTRLLDAVFLRFLRDDPKRAPEAFRRMFDRVPGPVTVRFLTERSSIVDELRIILALPKRPFLLAAARWAIERCA